MSAIEGVRWVVIPEGIEATRFADPESFYLSIRRSRWAGETTYVVSRFDQMGFTKNGVGVYLRHDVNAKHAHHTWDEATALATALADGDLHSVSYRHWRHEDEQRFGPMPTNPDAITNEGLTESGEAR